MRLVVLLVGRLDDAVTGCSLRFHPRRARDCREAEAFLFHKGSAYVSDAMTGKDALARSIVCRQGAGAGRPAQESANPFDSTGVTPRACCIRAVRDYRVRHVY